MVFCTTNQYSNFTLFFYIYHIYHFAQIEMYFNRKGKDDKIVVCSNNKTRQEPPNRSRATSIRTTDKFYFQK